MLVCYCIQSDCSKKTYVGATNNFNRRIRQHNGEISGGAKSTSGYHWHPIIHIVGFNNRNQLLRFEWLWKHCFKSKEKGIYRRIHMLEFLLEKEEWANIKILTTEEIASLLSCNQIIESINDL